MQVYITRKIKARMRHDDGTDSGCQPLVPGRYDANKTIDGALEILQSPGNPVYLLPFIWWEKMEMGEILLAAQANPTQVLVLPDFDLCQKNGC